MEKINKKQHHKLLVFLCMFCCTAFSQAKSGVENYNLISQGRDFVWMPVVHYQTKKGIYSELRYNYDAIHTFSCYGGKTISGGNKMNYSITPMAGFSVGDFKSIALATNAELEYRKFFVSSETQYSHALNKDQQSFFFTWSEAGMNFSEFFFAGMAFQYTLQRQAGDFEPGVIVGINLRNVSIPFYVFNPFRSSGYFVLGLNYEYQAGKKK